MTKRCTICNLKYCIFVFVRIDKTNSTVNVLSNYFHSSTSFQNAISVKKKDFQTFCLQKKTFLGLCLCLPVNKILHLNEQNNLNEAFLHKYICVKEF